MNPDATMIEREVRYSHQCCQQIFGFTPNASADEISREFIAFSSNTNRLGAGDSAVLSLFKPKTAALLADRVWLQIPGQGSQPDFVFGWQSPMAVRLASLAAFMRSANFPGASEREASESTDELTPVAREFVATTEGDLAKEYSQLTGASVTPLYNSVEMRDRDHKPGQYAVVTSAVERIALVTEEDLTWEQVIDFRQDANAKNAYRAFVHWLDGPMAGKSERYILDEISERLDAYQWALRKHGLQTVVGAIERTFDAKSIFGSATAALTLESIAHQPIMSLLGGASLLIGNAAIHAAARLIERQDILAKNREVAFVHQVKTRFGGNSGA